MGDGIGPLRLFTKRVRVFVGQPLDDGAPIGHVGRVIAVTVVALRIVVRLNLVNVLAVPGVGRVVGGVIFLPVVNVCLVGVPRLVTNLLVIGVNLVVRQKMVAGIQFIVCPVIPRHGGLGPLIVVPLHLLALLEDIGQPVLILLGQVSAQGVGLVVEENHRGGDLGGVIAVLGDSLGAGGIRGQVGAVLLPLVLKLVRHRFMAVERPRGLLLAVVVVLMGRRVAVVEEALDVLPLPDGASVVLVAVQVLARSGVVHGPLMKFIMEFVDQVLVDSGQAHPGQVVGDVSLDHLGVADAVGGTVG